MSLLTLLHAGLAGLLLAGAAWCAEAGLRRLALPARGAWVLAMALTLAAPFGLPAVGSALVERVRREVEGTPELSSVLLPDPELGRSAPPPAPSALNRVRPWIPLVWSALALLGIAAVGGGLSRLERRARQWSPARVWEEPVLVSPDFGPAVLGLRRSRTILPRWALSLPPRELELILRHERSHRKAMDPQLLALGVLLAALAPWNPALWLCLRRLRESVEKDCDRRVLRAGADRLAYARMLVSMRGRTALGPAPVPAPVESPSSLERRLRTMWIQPSRRPAVPALLAAAALVVMACESPSPTVTRPEPAQSSTVEASGALVEVTGSPDAPDPLVVVDGEIYEGAVSLLAPADIDRVEVLKGPAARTLYGEAGSDGVIQITTKEAAGTEGSAAAHPVAGTVRIRARPATGTFRVDPLPEGEAGVLRQLEVKAETGALVFVDGVEIEDGLPTTLRPEDIDRVEVLKGDAAATRFGTRGANGVIQIYTKGGSGGGR